MKKNNERSKTENRGEKDSGNHRAARVEGEIRDVIASYLLGPLRGEIPGMVSVTRVIISGDMRQAKVLVTVMDPTGETGLTGDALNKSTVTELQAHAYEIQEEIDHRLRMKFCPKLKFHFDDGFEHAMKVENILRQISNEKAAAPAAKPTLESDEE